MLLNIIYLLAGFIILVYGANLLVDGGAALAHRLKVPNIVIGLTVVAFGTSTPELVVNIISSIEGSSALALGNVLGSNIFNMYPVLHPGDQQKRGILSETGFPTQYGPSKTQPYQRFWPARLAVPI